MSTAVATTDHHEIRRWAERFNGRPSRVIGTSDARNDPGMLRLDFAEQDEGLEEISWGEWFDKFEESQLALLHAPDSRFNKLVRR